MFTGLVEDTGIIKGAGERRLSVSTKLDDIKLGDSIAVNGVCLTVVNINGGEITFDFSPQTGKVTNLGGLRAGDKVNLERALKLSSRLGGHFVSGHVDCVSKVISKEPLGDFVKLTFALDKAISAYVADKGSITVDGVSLTCAEVLKDSFTVYVIPETLKNTTLADIKPGAFVNIEADILAKYAQKILCASSKKELDEDFFKQNGF